MPPKDTKFVCQDEALELIYLWWRLGRNPPTESLPGHCRISWVFFRSSWCRSPREPNQDPESELCCQLLLGHLYIQKRSFHQPPEVVPNTHSQNGPDFTSPARAGLPFPEQTRTVSCFPQARWGSGLISVHCTPQAGKGKRKEQRFLLEEPREKHLAWLLLLLSVCTVKITTCYSHCIQQLQLQMLLLAIKLSSPFFNVSAVFDSLTCCGNEFHRLTSHHMKKYLL